MSLFQEEHEVDFFDNISKNFEIIQGEEEKLLDEAFTIKATQKTEAPVLKPPSYVLDKSFSTATTSSDSIKPPSKKNKAEPLFVQLDEGEKRYVEPKKPTINVLSPEETFRSMQKVKEQPKPKERKKKKEKDPEEMDELEKELAEIRDDEADKKAYEAKTIPIHIFEEIKKNPHKSSDLIFKQTVQKANPSSLENPVKTNLIAKLPSVKRSKPNIDFLLKKTEGNENSSDNFQKKEETTKVDSKENHPMTKSTDIMEILNDQLVVHKYIEDMFKSLYPHFNVKEEDLVRLRNLTKKISLNPVNSMLRFVELHRTLGDIDNLQLTVLFIFSLIFFTESLKIITDQTKYFEMLNYLGNKLSTYEKPKELNKESKQVVYKSNSPSPKLNKKRKRSPSRSRSRSRNRNRSRSDSRSRSKHHKHKDSKWKERNYSKDSSSYSRSRSPIKYNKASKHSKFNNENKKKLKNNFPNKYNKNKSKWDYKPSEKNDFRKKNSPVIVKQITACNGTIGKVYCDNIIYTTEFTQEKGCNKTINNSSNNNFKASNSYNSDHNFRNEKQSKNKINEKNFETTKTPDHNFKNSINSPSRKDFSFKNDFKKRITQFDDESQSQFSKNTGYVRSPKIFENCNAYYDKTCKEKIEERSFKPENTSNKLNEDFSVKKFLERMNPNKEKEKPRANVETIEIPSKSPSVCRNVKEIPASSVPSNSNETGYFSMDFLID